MPRIRLEAPGTIFRMGVHSRSLEIGRAPRIAAVVNIDLAENGLDLAEPAVERTIFPRREMQIEPIVRKKFLTPLPAKPEDGDIAVRAMLVSVSDLELHLAISVERLLSSVDCRGARVDGTRRLLAKPRFRVRAGLVLRYTFTIELERNVRKGKRWAYLDIIGDGAGDRSEEEWSSWSRPVVLEELGATCVDPGGRGRYNVWEESGQVLRPF